jgi:hypothetical protein
MRATPLAAGWWLVALLMAGTAFASHVQSGTVVGKVELCGGPPPGPCRAIEQAANVTAVATDTHRVAGRAAVRGGRFALTLTVGRYTLKLVVSGSGIGDLTRTVRIEPQRTVTVNLLVPIS